MEVPDELWEKVKARQALVRHKIGPEKAGGMTRTFAGRTYLFGGLLHCGPCGSPMTLTHDRYKCRSALRKWGCTNNRVIGRESLERQLTQAIASTIRSEAHVTEIKSLFMSELAAELKYQKAREDDVVSQKQTLAEEKKQLEAALRNLAEEVANYGGNDVLRETMRSKSARLIVVKDMLKRAERPATAYSDEDIPAFFRDALSDLAEVLLCDPVTSKQELLKRVSSLTLTPVEQDGEPAFALSGDLTLFTEEEALQLPCFGTRTEELQPYKFKLDGFVLKLDSRGNIVSITGSRHGIISEIPKQVASEPVEHDLAA